MRRRVVITGVGCITPLGADCDEVWSGLLAGRSGAAPITLFDASSFPVRIASEVKDWSIADVGENPREWEHHSRQTRFALAAAIKAAKLADVNDDGLPPAATGVYLGCGELFPDFGQFAATMSSSLARDDLEVDHFMQQSFTSLSANDEFALEPGLATGLIAARFNAQGPNANFTAACVSSSKAIGESAEAIRSGQAEVMLTGGAHSMIHPFGLTGFHRLSTLSTYDGDPREAARPFDRDRDGFVVGEGGVVFVLEELEHARRRGAEILAEVTGYGQTHDAFRITDMEPKGRSATRCIQEALADARLNPDDIDYINAHGSGTEMNDKVETLAIKNAFGPHAYRVPVSATKSMTGHLTTACGALEVFICTMSVQRRAIPPTINYATPDPNCDLDYVPNTARDLECRHVLNNSFGFGGQNVCLVISRFDS